MEEQCIYTRWERNPKVCPDTNGTVLVYEGLATGSSYNHSGGEVNYICITKTPSQLSSTEPVIYSLLHGSEYQHPIFNSLHKQNVPCAVCYTSVCFSKLMIPGEKNMSFNVDPGIFFFLLMSKKVSAV